MTFAGVLFQEGEAIPQKPSDPLLLLLKINRLHLSSGSSRVTRSEFEPDVLQLQRIASTVKKAHRRLLVFTMATVNV